MAKKKEKLKFYSTNPDFVWNDGEEEATETLPVQQQKIRVTLDRKQRKGKEVTLVTGFVGTPEDLSDLGKLLKNKCGAGGSAKEGQIIVQGNHVDKVIGILVELGYKNTKKSGG